MEISQFLDATYLKTPKQANISKEENLQRVIHLVQEAILYNYKLIMIRAEYIKTVKQFLEQAKASVSIGTVVDFPKGNSTLEKKLQEAQKAINLGANELDFVINYTAFKAGNLELIKKEVTNCVKLCLNNTKVAKFIIEVAALSNQEIIVISQLIKNVVIDNFGEENAKNVFVKSATGFYKTENNKPNGATLEIMKLISENAKPLKVKAAGGVKDYEIALKMIALGVDRIGTSAALAIVNKKQNTKQGY